MMQSNEFISIESLERRGYKPASLKNEIALLKQLFEGRDLYFGKKLMVFNTQKQFVGKLIKCEKKRNTYPLYKVTSLEMLESLGFEPLNEKIETKLLLLFLENKALYVSRNCYVYDAEKNFIGFVLPIAVMWG